MVCYVYTIGSVKKYITLCSRVLLNLTIAGGGPTLDMIFIIWNFSNEGETNLHISDVDCIVFEFSCLMTNL